MESKKAENQCNIFDLLQRLFTWIIRWVLWLWWASRGHQWL